MIFYSQILWSNLISKLSVSLTVPFCETYLPEAPGRHIYFSLSIQVWLDQALASLGQGTQPL